MLNKSSLPYVKAFPVVGPVAFQEMQGVGIPMDKVAYGAAVSACATGGLWLRARSLLDEMRSVNLPPDVIAFRYSKFQKRK